MTGLAGRIGGGLLLAVLGASTAWAAGEAVPPPEKPTTPAAAEPAPAPSTASATPAPAPAPDIPVELQEVVIGAAPVAGTFYPAAGALCREVNHRQAVSGLRCLVEETEGSADNLQRLRDGKLELAVVQSDWAFHAAAGSTIERQPPFAELRSLLLLQPQVMTLVAGAKSGVLALSDLAGKRLSIGPAGSGINDAGRSLLQALGLENGVTLMELPVEQQAQAICGGQIDAFLLPVAHPNGAIAEAVDLCGAILVDLQDEAIDRMVTTWPYLVKAMIPAGAYASTGNDVAGYGLVSTLVTTTALSDEAAYQIVKAVYEGLDDLRAQHPTLALLSAQTMSGPGLATVPLHPGALRYYQERGWR